MAWKPYQDLKLKSRQATASMIICKHLQAIVKNVNPDQSDVVQKNKLLPILNKINDRIRARLVNINV